MQELHSFKPVQHPKNIDSTDSSIVSYKVPPINLTPYNQIPIEAQVEVDDIFQDSPPGSKSVEACILGPANAGKSSLINTLVMKNISAVSNKYGTTDEATIGISTDIEAKT